MSKPKPTEKYLPGTGKYLPTTGKYLPTTEKYLPGTGKYLPTTEKYLPGTEESLPGTTLTAKQRETLRNLTPEEKRALREFIEREAKKRGHEIEGLVGDEVLERYYKTDRSKEEVALAHDIAILIKRIHSKYGGQEDKLGIEKQIAQLDSLNSKELIDLLERILKIAKAIGMHDEVQNYVEELLSVEDHKDNARKGKFGDYYGKSYKDYEYYKDGKYGKHDGGLTKVIGRQYN